MSPDKTSAVETKSPPELTDDPYRDDVLANPFEFHHRLREAGPLVRLTRHGVFATGRYAQVRSVVTNWQDFISGAGVGLRGDLHRENQHRGQPTLLQADPPFHDAPRAAAEQVLSPRLLARFREQWTSTAEAMVDGLLERGEVDAVADIAKAFPLSVFPDAVGMPQTGRADLLVYSDHLFNMVGPENALVAAGQAAFAKLTGWMARQGDRDNLDPRGLGADAWAAADRGDVTSDQAAAIARAMLTAGLDTTVNALGAVIDGFLSAPAQWQVLRADPGRARVAFDEAIRWASPVQTFTRTASRDVVVGDTVVPEGERVLLFFGAANRDPRRWERPDEFDLDRDPSGHLGFGFGIHQCVGQHVARLEAETVLRALVRRVARIEPAGEPTPHLNNSLRGWASLPVRLVAA